MKLSLSEKQPTGRGTAQLIANRPSDCLTDWLSNWNWKHLRNKLENLKYLIVQWIYHFWYCNIDCLLYFSLKFNCLILLAFTLTLFFFFFWEVCKKNSYRDAFCHIEVVHLETWDLDPNKLIGRNEFRLFLPWMTPGNAYLHQLREQIKLKINEPTMNHALRSTNFTLESA